MEKLPRISPPLNWRLTSWLCASPSELSAEAGAELRACLFSRMPSLLLSAAGAVIVEILALCRHPTPWFLAWLVLDGGLLLWVRLGLTAAIMRHRKRHHTAASPPGIVSDLFVLVEPVWCAVLGCGTGVCLASGDLGISLAGALLAMASVGAFCGRIPGSPRLARLQMSLILFPLVVGGIMTGDPMIHLIVGLSPIYILALGSINLQLHSDYVEMVVGRQENRRLALRCPLTALPNRRMFDSILVATLRGAAERGVNVFVLCLDLDGFKAVNDRLGHAAGDLLLKEVAVRLLRCLPADGLVARIGGDEFAVLITAQRSMAAETLADRIVQTLGEPIDIEGSSAQVGVSIGIARCAGLPANPGHLMREADQALYLAKDAGKNTFRWHQAMPSDTADARRRSTDDVLLDLRTALEKMPLFRSNAPETADPANTQSSPEPAPIRWATGA